MKNMTATEVRESWERWEAECRTMGKVIDKVNRKLATRLVKRMLIVLSNHGPIT